MSYEDTRLWQEAFGGSVTSNESGDAKARIRLRNAYLQFRERAAALATEIGRDMPTLTVHDISHLDALWEMADLVFFGNASDNLDVGLNPLETFVLGCAFLTHDLAQSKAALDLSANDLASDALYRDILASIVKPRLESSGGTEEASTAEREAALSQFLRERHAAAAETLPFAAWKHTSGQIYLIDDQELRQYLGEAVGKVAASHHWPVRSLGEAFDEKLGCPISLPLPPCDLLTIACLLRLADGAQLDARRAPSFLQALKKPQGESGRHWNFQNHLLQPQAKEDRIIFTSGPSFEIDEIDAWWLCYDSLSYLDSQMASVDSLLTDSNRNRFRLRAVAGVEDPRRLSKLVKTKGWLPVDTQIRVGNVASLVLRLGGDQLYGDDPTVPLRELIQNAGDAVQARRAIDPLFSGGSIKVSLSERGGQWMLIVRDDGVGMSEAVLIGALIDFGASFWRSVEARREFPGLTKSNFISTGRYGIGFFSVFMLGDDVRVTSRRFSDVTQGAKVLHFRNGADSRPILSNATDSLKHMTGTVIEVVLRKNPFEKGGLIVGDGRPPTTDFTELCGWLCPTFPVKIEVSYLDQESSTAVDADDWKTIPAEVLLHRILKSNDKKEQKDIAAFVSFHAPLVRPILKGDGTIIGRASLTYTYLGLGYRDDDSLVVTVGGCRASSNYFLGGVILGESSKASRDEAKLLVTWEELSLWAEEQADLMISSGFLKSRFGARDQILTLCGIERDGLFLARSSSGDLTKNELLKFARRHSTIIVVDSGQLHDLTKNREVTFNENVLICSIHYWTTMSDLIEGNSPGGIKWSAKNAGAEKSFLGPAISAIAEAWDVPLDRLGEDNRFEKEITLSKIDIGVDKHGDVVSTTDYWLLQKETYATVRETQ